MIFSEGHIGCGSGGSMQHDDHKKEMFTKDGSIIIDWLRLYFLCFVSLFYSNIGTVL